MSTVHKYVGRWRARFAINHSFSLMCVCCQKQNCCYITKKVWHKNSKQEGKKTFYSNIYPNFTYLENKYIMEGTYGQLRQHLLATGY